MPKGLYLGIDGCKEGWVAVALHEDGTFCDSMVAKELSVLIDYYPEVKTIGVDMPLDLVNEPTRIADQLVRKELGPIAYGENEEEVFLGRSVTKQQNMSEETAKKVDLEVKKIVESGYDRARKVLTEKIDDLHKLAKALLVYETLTGDEIRDLILKNITPKKLVDSEDDEDNKKESSALDTIGLKPKPAL